MHSRTLGQGLQVSAIPVPTCDEGVSLLRDGR